jgi:uncharacterized membrane protein
MTETLPADPSRFRWLKNFGILAAGCAVILLVSRVLFPKEDWAYWVFLCVVSFAWGGICPRFSR